MNSVLTATLENQGDVLVAKQLSIALIGPNEPRRLAVSSVLAEYSSIEVYEFSSYPTHLNTVSRLLAQQFDIVIVDLDSEPKVALDLVESIRGETTLTVVPYTEEADPEVMARCKRAGAREYLVLPARQSILDRIFARARIGLPSDAQPVSRPGPEVIAAPKTDAWRDNSPAVGAPVHMEDEDLRPASRPASGRISGKVSGGNGAALESQPKAAPRGQVTDQALNHVSSSPLWPGGVVVIDIPYTPETTPLAAPTEDEDPPQKLRTADPGNSGPSAAASQWAKFFSGASVAPAISNGPVKPAVEQAYIVETVQKTPAIETGEIDFLSFHSDLADLGEEDPNRKKWVRVGAASFAVLVLVLFAGPRLMRLAKNTLAAQSAEMRPVANGLGEAAKTPKPSPSATIAKGHPSATLNTRQQDTNTAPPHVDSTLMGIQLASAPRIPQDVKAPRKEEAPPPAGFDGANTEEIGSGAGVVDRVFSEQARPTVKVVPPPPVVVPVEVAEKLLIHKVLPIYPPDAWKHYVRGKVVLEIVLSETGSVEDLKVVSGPAVFLQAAHDAVKTWRYKPYVVNGKPARVQTNVTLTFDPYRQ